MRLYGFGAAFGLADASPFVLKVEAFLRWQGIAYEKSGDLGAVRRSRNRKLPLLDDDGVLVPDSHAIIDHVVRTRGLTIDADLSDAQRTEAYWVTQTLEEHLYFVFVWMRWWPDESWPQVRETLFAGAPAPLRGPISALVRRSVKKQVWAQGTARYPVAQILAMRDACLQHLTQGLGDRAYWFGDQPHALDCLLYAFLAPALMSHFQSQYLPMADQHQALRDYVQRMHQRLGFEPVS